MKGCDNLTVFTKLLVTARGASQLLEARRGSGAGSWPSVALLFLGEAEASTALL